MRILTNFASEAAASSDLFGALGIDWRMLILQIVAFVILVLVLAKFVYPWLMKSVDERHEAIEASAEAAKEAQAKAEQAEANSEKLLKKARDDAADILALAQKEASKTIEAAEAKAAQKAEHLIEQAEARIHSDIAAARQGLQTEMVGLVIAATEKVIEQKLDAKQDTKLIKEALTETR